jgi:hypothetical protein
VTHIRQEINLHIKECEEFGLTQAEMEQYPESQGTASEHPGLSNIVADIRCSLHSILSVLS